LPGMSVPGGFSSDGRPIGLQIITKPFAEQKIFDIAASLEMNQFGL
jgi:aspartyl-tRNA(Asn)/glutamyl-tRNA(Gln) amidotransferase subunit A